jgi:hypothetical protein
MFFRSGRVRRRRYVIPGTIMRVLTCYVHADADADGFARRRTRKRGKRFSLSTPLT